MKEASGSGWTESKAGRGEFGRTRTGLVGGSGDLLGTAQSIGGSCESPNIGPDSTR